MSILSVTPYLILYGRAEQAIALYEEALGASVQTLKRFGDIDQSCPTAMRDLVMHAELRVGGALLMLSDGGPNDPPPEGGRVSVALGLDDEEETRRRFAALAASGKVVEPLFASPWGSLFGVVQDAHGVTWMFDCTKS